MPLLVNSEGRRKAGVIYVGNKRTLPGMELLLPFFPHKAAALHQLLDVLGDRNPELFPPPHAAEWHDNDEYQSPAVQDLRKKRISLEGKHRATLAELAAEERKAAAAQEPFLALVRESGDELASAVELALEWLNFGVVNVDDEHRSRDHPLEEDFRLDDFSDGDYLGIADALGRKGNIKQRDYQDLRTYMTARATDPRFRGRRIQGLLIANSNWRIEPSKRDRLFGTDKRDWDAKLTGEGITAVFGWDLFQLIGQVLAGKTHS